MGEKRNGTLKWIARILAVCVVSFVTWWATQVWSTQQETSQTNTDQDIDIKTLQMNIISVEKTALRIERCLAEDRIHRKQQDSILMDVAIKVNIMFDGR